MSRKVKRFVWILILCLSVSCIAYADTAYVFCRPDDFVNIRYAPTTNSDDIGRFECGDSFETDGVKKKDKKNRTWLHIINAGLEVDDAWICASYVQYSPIIIETAYATVVAKGRTAIRKSPNGKLNKWVENGDDLKIVARSDEWALTERGCVSMDCIEVWYE